MFLPQNSILFDISHKIELFLFDIAQNILTYDKITARKDGNGFSPFSVFSILLPINGTNTSPYIKNNR